MSDTFHVIQDPHISELSVSLFGQDYLLRPLEDLELKKSELGEAMQTQPALYAFYATLRDLADKKYEIMKREKSLVEARVGANYRQTGALPGGIKITEAGLEAAVKTSKDVVEATKEMIEAEYFKNILSSICKAFEQKRDMIVALSSRANNTTWNDQDVETHVSGIIVDTSALKNKGTYPSRR